ncbi:hypothetical protein CALCODRAFT_481024 [Calocera cornea HHB12733]|uniref:NmrA-like domain-containing protein n=1 Tax=Calocera cornea HHB12733 TaxID=1353952 RepID=A0A165HZ26_9BASI|nr:hypothetical protein CALCODRAFT_481024 [Calocera cornea HHB12733]
MPKKLVVVVGATGGQGIPRLALTSKDIEMVPVSWNDKTSLTNAFKVAYVVFGVTPSYRKESETEHGKNMSSLPSAREQSNGKYTPIRAMEEKSAVDKYIKVVG